VVCGWFLLDVFLLSISGEPALVLDVLPTSLAMIGIGALLGTLLARYPRLVLVGVPLLLVVSKLPAFTDVFLAETQVWLIRMAVLCWAAIAAVSLLRCRLGFGGLRAGLCLGTLAALLLSTYRLGSQYLVWVPGTAAGACFLLGFLPGPALRRALTVLVLVFPLGVIASFIASPHRPMRPDLEPPTPAAPAEAPNLVLIIVDTLRADHLASYGYERVTTPGLDAFARDEATLYTQARSTSSYTLSSHASLLTGLQSVEHGSTHPRPRERPIRAGVTTLAERLRAIGYRTGFVVANGLYLCPEFGLDRGFEHFDNRLGGRTYHGRGFYLLMAQLAGRHLEVGCSGHRNARRITDLALGWLDSVRETSPAAPFFLAVNYLDVHGPYFPIAPYDKAFSDEQPHEPLTPDLGVVPLLYDRELLYTDAQITRLFDGLKARGAFDHTVVVVTSDHGEALGERGYPEHCWTLYENVVHVPLMVKPAGPRGKPVEDRRVSGAEVHDIALRELGLLGEGAHTSKLGTDLIAEWYGDELTDWIPEWADRVDADLLTDVMAYFDGPRKFIVRSDGTVEAFDIEADPQERSPLPLSDEERAAALARARRFWQDHPPDPHEKIDLDEEVLEGMQALGYAGDS